MKEAITLYDWYKHRADNYADKKINQNQYKEDIEERLQQHEKAIHKLAESQDQILSKVESMSEKIEMLIDSDRDDIKSQLTKDHHYFCYQKKWIDDYSLDCCEKRYSHYKDEGGNSFILGFMEEMRALPKVPPKE